jgi:hypothetical protein
VVFFKYRLTIPLALTVAFVAGITPFLSYGPNWEAPFALPHESQMCRDYGWRVITYIINFFSLEEDVS